MLRKADQRHEVTLFFILPDANFAKSKGNMEVISSDHQIADKTTLNRRSYSPFLDYIGFLNFAEILFDINTIILHPRDFRQSELYS